MVGMLIFVLDIKKSFSFRILNLSSITLSFFQAYYVLTAKDVKHLKKTQTRIEPETPIESDLLDVEQQDPSRKPRRRKYPKKVKTEPYIIELGEKVFVAVSVEQFALWKLGWAKFILYTLTQFYIHTGVDKLNQFHSSRVFPYHLLLSDILFNESWFNRLNNITGSGRSSFRLKTADYHSQNGSNVTLPLKDSVS